jgi:hypothetical protein
MRPRHTDEATTGLISTIVRPGLGSMHSECFRGGIVGEQLGRS